MCFARLCNTLLHCMSPPVSALLEGCLAPRKDVSLCSFLAPHNLQFGYLLSPYLHRLLSDGKVSYTTCIKEILIGSSLQSSVHVTFLHVSGRFQFSMLLVERISVTLPRYVWSLTEFQMKIVVEIFMCFLYLASLFFF